MDLSVPANISHTAPIGLKWRSNTLFIFTTFALGVVVDTFLYGIIVPVLPFMLKDRVHVPASEVQTTISNLLAIYGVASCLSSPVTGILADKYSSSRKMPFVLGLISLLLSTILLAVGRTVFVLAVARFFQGAAAGTVWTIGLALMRETVGPKNMGKTMGTVFSLGAVSGFFSPIVGGLLYAKTGYQGVFGVGLALVSVDLVMRLLMIESKVAARYIPRETNEPYTENEIEPSESTSLLSEQFVDRNIFQLPEPKSRITRAVPILLMFRNPTLLTAFWLSIVTAALIGAFDATIPLVAASLYDFDSFQAGLLFLPLGGMDFIFGPLFGWCIDHFGTRVNTIIGFVWLVPALALLRLPTEPSIISHLDRGHQIALFSCILAANGFGIAIPGAVTTVESSKIVERYTKANKQLFNQVPYAQLFGINSMLFSIGLVVGPLVGGWLKVSIGYGNMNAVLAGVCGFTAVLSALYIGLLREEEE